MTTEAQRQAIQDKLIIFRESQKDQSRCLDCPVKGCGLTVCTGDKALEGATNKDVLDNCKGFTPLGFAKGRQCVLHSPTTNPSSQDPNWRA
jgi:hypothetical protein